MLEMSALNLSLNVAFLAYQTEKKWLIKHSNQGSGKKTKI